MHDRHNVSKVPATLGDDDDEDAGERISMGSS